MKKAFLYASVSILFWSTLATVSKLLLGTLNSFGVLMFSSFFACLALFFANLITGKLKILKTYKFKDFLLIISTSSLGTFFYYAFLYAGTSKMAASQAFIINYLWPIMSVVFACIILKEKITFRKSIAFALSFIGVLTVAGGELLNFSIGSLFGIVLCLLAAMSYGLFTVLCKKYVYDYMVSMMLSFFATFLLTVIINLCLGMPTGIGLGHFLGFLWNGIFIMAVATVTWALALNRGGTAKISNLAYTTPFLSLVWTFLILKEPIKPLSILGLLIIIAGILIQLKDKNYD